MTEIEGLQADFLENVPPRHKKKLKDHQLGAYEVLDAAQEAGLTKQQKADLTSTFFGQTNKEIAQKSVTKRSPQAVSESMNAGLKKSLAAAHRNQSLRRKG